MFGPLVMIRIQRDGLSTTLTENLSDHLIRKGLKCLNIILQSFFYSYTYFTTTLKPPKPDIHKTAIAYIMMTIIREVTS